MRRTTLAFALVLFGGLALNPPTADARGFKKIPRNVEICHVELGSQETLILGPISAVLHLIFHRFDVVGPCDDLRPE